MAVLGLQRFINFVAQFVENVACSAGDIHVFQMPRARQVDRKFGLHAPRTESEQSDAIAQTHGLAHVMGHEDDGAASLGPDLFELVVEQER